MAVFTSNQVNHVYVAKAVQSSALSSNGDIICKKTADNELYFEYKNAEGGKIRSDLIPVKNIMWAKVISGNHRSQLKKLKKYTVAIPSSPTANETYTVVLEMTLHNGVESTYRKTVSVVGRSGDSQSDFSQRLFNTLKASFDRDEYVNDKFKLVRASSSPYTISIIELPQSAKYKVGLFANEGIQFKVFSDELTINSGGSSLVPLDATIADITGSGSTSNAYTIGNSYDIADLEYFALGERGDKYRLIGWPNAAPSKTMVDSIGDSVSYNILNIHFAFTDSNEGVQKSEKDITIIVPMNTPDSTTSPVTTTATTINALLSQIAFNVLGAGGSGHGGSTGNDAFDLVDGKIEILDIPGGKKTQLN